jgi:hypothetical protein
VADERNQCSQTIILLAFVHNKEPKLRESRCIKACKTTKMQQPNFCYNDDQGFLTVIGEPVLEGPETDVRPFQEPPQTSDWPRTTNPVNIPMVRCSVAPEYHIDDNQFAQLTATRYSSGKSLVVTPSAQQNLRRCLGWCQGSVR